MRARAVRTAVAAVAVGLLLAGCSGDDRPGGRGEGEACGAPDAQHRSPSGEWVLTSVPGPEQNGVKTARPEIVAADSASSSAPAWSSQEVYSLRHGLCLTWSSASDLAWVASGDVGVTALRPDDAGSGWSEVDVSSVARSDVPDPVRKSRPDLFE